MAHQAHDRRVRSFSMSLSGMGVAVALTLVPGMHAATAAGPVAQAGNSYKTHITQADKAIARAAHRIHAHQYPGARTALAGRLRCRPGVVRSWSRRSAATIRWRR